MDLRRWKKYMFRRICIVIAIVLLSNLLITSYILDNSSAKDRTSLVTFEDPRTHAVAFELSPAKVPCEMFEVELVLVVGSVVDARDAATAIKTIVHHRRVAPLQLHIFVTELTHHIMQTLLNTWPLSQVNYMFYEVPDVMANSTGDWSSMKIDLPTILPVTVKQVLIVDVKLRLVNDIGILWQSIIGILDQDDFAIGLVSRPDCSQALVQCWMFHLIALNLKAARKWKETEKLSNLHSRAELNIWLSTHAEMIFSIYCSWALVLKKAFNATACLNLNPVQGILWTKGITLTYSGHHGVEAAVESIRVIANSEPLNYPPSPSLTLPVACRRQTMTDQPSTWLPWLTDLCGHFRYVAALLRRTHLFYFGGDLKTKGTTDVTLATQLALNRLTRLERVLANWRGPASITLHVRDSELEAATDRIQSSSLLGRRKNVNIHIVYQRLAYNPINYLRNIAINNSRTPYTFYVDVDLVPNPGLYDSLRRRLAALQNTSRRNIAFIVPTFEAFTNLPKLPHDKSELLRLMDESKIGAFRMKHGWNLGHKPTNYNHWVTTNDPYDVQYRDAFEPYVVVPTDTEVRFDERLLERMAPKALYCRWLHGAGFILRVLPDVFVIHLPHAASPGVSQWYHIPGYGRCATIISDEGKKELRQRYPNVKF